LHWRDVLRQHGYTDARRGQQYAGNPDAPDVVGGPENFHCEVKSREQHFPWQWMEEAVADAGDKTPYVAMKRNRSPWLVILRAEDFLKLAGALPAKPAVSGESRSIGETETAGPFDGGGA
jgi:hypothetical protein